MSQEDRRIQIHYYRDYTPGHQDRTARDKKLHPKIRVKIQMKKTEMVYQQESKAIEKGSKHEPFKYAMYFLDILRRRPSTKTGGLTPKEQHPE